MTCDFLKRGYRNIMQFKDILERARAKEEMAYPDIGSEWHCPDLPRKYKGKPGKYRSPAERKLKYEKNYETNRRSCVEWQDAPAGAMDIYEILCKMWAAGMIIHAADIPADILAWLISPNGKHAHIGLIRVTPDAEVVLLDDRRRRADKPERDAGERQNAKMVTKAVMDNIIEQSYRNIPGITPQGIAENIKAAILTGTTVKGTDIEPEPYWAYPSAERVKKLRDRNENVVMRSKPTRHRWARGWQTMPGEYEVYESPEPHQCGCGCGERLTRSNQKYASDAHRKRAARKAAR